jgi:hypothetical protein
MNLRTRQFASVCCGEYGAGVMNLRTRQFASVCCGEYGAGVMNLLDKVRTTQGEVARWGQLLITIIWMESDTACPGGNCNTPPPLLPNPTPSPVSILPFPPPPPAHCSPRTH